MRDGAVQQERGVGFNRTIRLADTESGLRDRAGVVGPEASTERSDSRILKGGAAAADRPAKFRFNRTIRLADTES